MTPEQDAESHGHRLSPPRGEVYVHGRRQPHSATCECGATFTTAGSEEQLHALHALHLAHVVAHVERSSMTSVWLLQTREFSTQGMRQTYWEPQGTFPTRWSALRAAVPLRRKDHWLGLSVTEVPFGAIR